MMKWMVIAAVLSLPVLAHAADGIRLAPDASALLANKDVGDARWAIALNTDITSHAQGNLTGSIFRPGDEPLFFWCDAQEALGDPDDVANATFVWQCYAQERCRPDRCTTGLSAWQNLGRVELKGSFFLP